MMVEGGGHEISEEDLLGAVEFGHAEIKKIVTAINQLQKKAGKTKREYPLLVVDRRRSKRGFARRSRKTSPRRCASSRSTSATRRSRSSRREAALEKVGAKDNAIREILEDKSSKDFDKIIKTMEEEELRVMVVDEKLRPDGRKADEIRPIWSKVGTPAARSRNGRLHARSNASAHRRDARLDRRRTAPRRHHGDSEQALHALLQLPAVFGRRNAPDARSRPPRNRPRPPRGTRAGADPAAAGRVPVHDAPDQRNARIQRFVVDGVGLRFDARADGCRRADSESTSPASRWA